MVVTGEGRSGEVAAVCAGLGAPKNGTPLAETTKRVADKIAGMVEQSLIMPGEKACVVIATDGEPNDKAAFKREVEPRAAGQVASLVGVPRVHQRRL